MNNFNSRSKSAATVEVVTKKRRRAIGLDSVPNEVQSKERKENNEIDEMVALVKRGIEERLIRQEVSEREAINAAEEARQAAQQAAEAAAKNEEEAKRKSAQTAQRSVEAVPAKSAESFKDRIAPKSPSEAEKRRDSKRVLIQDIEFNENREVDRRSIASIKRAKIKRGGTIHHKQKLVREVSILGPMSAAELAAQMSEKVGDVLRVLNKFGLSDQSIDPDTAELIVHEMGHTAKRAERKSHADSVLHGQVVGLVEQVRPPVVTVIGHVDHGKTSLLDAIRSTSVVSSEAGGITQHIGAYQITTASGQHITFIDTPGHEAFTQMRSRGVKATDIVVLVVAADDGVKEQTIEAINHAKAAGVPIVVALNKMDKPGADPTRVIRELLSHHVVSESLGGDVMVVEVSARTGAGLNKLEEVLLLQAEMLELKAFVDAKARGVVIESRIDPAKGIVSTFLVQSGTLKKGDIVVAGTGLGKVRLMQDYQGIAVQTALPSTPVEVFGLSEAPSAGEIFAVVGDEKQARAVVQERIEMDKAKKEALRSKNSLSDLMDRMAALKDTSTKTIKVIVKADVSGSNEAIVDGVNKLGSDEIKVNVIHSGVGAVSESDALLAQTARAVILGFNVRPNPGAKATIDRHGLDVRHYSIIYDLLDDLKMLIAKMSSPTAIENCKGKAEIRNIFDITGVGKIAGCMVLEGKMTRGDVIRLVRNNVVIHTGKLRTLKRFKEDVKEVNSGYECGICLERYQDIQLGDQIHSYELIEKSR